MDGSEIDHRVDQELAGLNLTDFVDCSTRKEPDMQNFEKFGDDVKAKNSCESDDVILSDDMSTSLTSRLVSTTRPLLTAIEDEKNSSSILPELSSMLSDSYSDADNTAAMTSNGIPESEASAAPTSNPVGDQLSIGGSGTEVASELESLRSSTGGSFAFDKPFDLVEENLLPTLKDPKIGTEPIPVSIATKETGSSAYETIAHSATVKGLTIMEDEASGAGSKADGCCPFSPGVWFSPEKLHPCVADFVYWRDVKKSGILFGSTLVLLLSLKYFSFISVAAYLILAVLCITVSFRIYKNVLQAVQKSNEGHPFKEYLDMNINLSHEKLRDVSEVLIHHVNSVTNKLRSLILVEDLVDTLKLLIFAWCLTYVGAWLNGMTVIILSFVSAFTLPKIYETNKTQIDAYADIIRTKGKEMMEMINAKIPLGKKKKEE